MSNPLLLPRWDPRPAHDRLVSFGDVPMLVLALAACVILTGCTFLKPANTPIRHFVLTPLPTAPSAGISHSATRLGIGQVRLPAYLLGTSLAVRRGNNEIEYLPLVLWAERLDASLQRVLAANLAALLATDHVRLSAWRSEEVQAEVYVAIEQFDIDGGGQALLSAWWRVLAPGGEQVLNSGHSRLTRSGPSPDKDPAGAVATLSEVLADFSRELAHALPQTAMPLQRSTGP